jgi:hypothetical protein
MKDSQSNRLEQYKYIVDKTSIVSKPNLLGQHPSILGNSDISLNVIQCYI